MSEIKKSRKVTYYIGMGMMILGFILFISVFFSFASVFNNFSNGFNSSTYIDSNFNAPYMGFNRGSSFGFSFTNPILGMILIIVGRIVMNIGAKGAAGSGLILDPEQSREDLKPFNEAKGGMINDVISNIDVVDKFVNPQEKEVIKVRCTNCKALNDEDAKFCKECGNAL